jgi:hypothetical protein
MSELQTGLLAIGALVVAGVLAYNRLQERAARRDAERAFRSGHPDVLLDGIDSRREPTLEPASSPAPRSVARAAVREEGAQPDPNVDYIVEIAFAESVSLSTLQEPWRVIERRHAHRALLAGDAEGKLWRAGLLLASRDGAVGEADLIEFRSALDAIAASHGGTVSAPEMRAAVEAARSLDELCGESDIQVVMHVNGGPFPGARLRAAAEASGLQLESDGRFALRDEQQRLLYTLGARDGAAFAAETMATASLSALTLALDVGRAPDTRRSFESMARLGAQLASVLGGHVVDDAGNVLDERAIGAIAQQLDAVRAKLDERGIRPGSPSALRLFS